MKKGNKRLLVVIALLLLVVISYSTYAIYKSSFSGSSTATAALWAIDVTDGSSTIVNNTTLEFDLNSCTNTYTEHVATGKIAPGSTCKKTITIDADGSEVDVDWTATVGTLTTSTSGKSLPSGITAGITGGSNGSKNGIITYSSTSGEMEATVEIYVTWAATDSDTTINPEDTAFAEGTAGVVSVPVTLVAKQAHNKS